MTPERAQKFDHVLKRRQPDLTVILENVHDPHNISAVLRTCDAVGITEVYVLNTIAPKPKRYGKKSSSSALKWVNVKFYDNMEACMAEVRKKHERIFATHLSCQSVDLYEFDLTQSVALLFGNEKEGLSGEIRQHADGNFIIPMVGMVPSLNISVACAITLYEAYRQRDLKKMYDQQGLSDGEYETILQQWERRELRKGKSD